MPRRTHLAPHLTVDELARRSRGAQEPHERSWFQILWLLAKGQTATAIAESTGYSRYWIGQVARRYNQEGPAGMQNRRYTYSHRATPLLNPETLTELAAAVRGPAPRCPRAAPLCMALPGGFCPSGPRGTVFHLASTVNIPLFEVELAAFACQVGAQLRMPDHVHLLFLPAYSPEVQPAEHLWPLTNTALANRHVASIDDLEDAQAPRCFALQARPDLIRSTTLFHW